MSEPRERPLVFGRAGHLVGVATHGRADTPLGPPPTVVFLNAGIIHRVSPNRFYTRLVRALAQAGVPSLRFDLSGLGDSARAPEDATTPRAEIVQRDVADALEALTRRGQDRFVLAGLCSGADDAFRAVSRDPRVVGGLLLDPRAFRTVGYYLHHYGRRVLRLASWKNAVMGRTGVARSLAARLTGGAASKENGRRLSASTAEARAEVRRQLEAMVARRVRLLYVFTAGLEFRYNYRDQFLHAFPGLDFRRCLTLEYFAGADHTFSREADRARLQALVVRWMTTTRFEEAAKAPVGVGGR